MKKVFLSIVISLLMSACWAQEEMTANFDYAGVKEVRVEGKFADVIIEGTSGDRLTGEAVISGNFDEDDYEIVQGQEGARVFIEIQSNRRGWSWRSNRKSYIRLKVPKKCELRVKNGSGSVEAMDVESKDIRLISGSGSVKAYTLLGENILIKSGSGSVKGENITADYLDATSGSGRVSLESIKADVKATSGSGSVKVSNIKGLLDLNSGSGSVEAERVTLTRSSHFKSGSGSVRLYLDNNLEDFSFDLRSGTGSVRLDGERMGKKYYYKNGEIMISATSGSGSVRIEN